MQELSLKALKGVGPSRIELLEKAGISDLSRLLCYLPTSFRENRIIPLSESDPGVPCMTRLVVRSAPRISFFGGKRRALRFTASDEGATCEIVFFYQTYLQSRFCVGDAFYFYGRFKKNGTRYLCFSPEYEPATAPLQPVTPLYPLVKGLSRKLLTSLLEQALPYAESLLPENLPDEVIFRCGLMSRAEAARQIHFPSDLESAQRARERFAFEELYFFRLDLLLMNQRRGIPSADGMRAYSMAPFFEILGFTPTNAQHQAIAEICADLIGDGLGGKIPAMHRLLQGDVGSGKTAVAAAAAYLCLKNGKKAVVMAPTELLAAQHAEKLSVWFSKFGFATLLLTGSSTKAERKVIEAALASAEPCIIVGTHALLTERVKMESVSLVIVDEQHRFGVRQRDTLLQKAEEKNLLVMSATPIPRTLALFLFSEDDVSVLSELPPGRTPVSTFYVGEDKRSRVDAYIRKELESGGRAYIVCPLIEESEESDLMAAESRFEAAKKLFAPYEVGFLHGRMSSEKKAQAMRDFACGKTRVLVSTTVIEIGIDVPEASVMCVENADRFGLATLHQLRGRVGRGDRASTCILLSSAKGKKARERLRALCDTSDGFQLSEIDMQTRGPGDFFGVAQSGKVVFEAARTADEALLRKAAQAAEEFFEKTVDN